MGGGWEGGGRGMGGGWEGVFIYQENVLSTHGDAIVSATVQMA